jgi:hypothetical protein
MKKLFVSTGLIFFYIVTMAQADSTRLGGKMYYLFSNVLKRRSPII